MINKIICSYIFFACIIAVFLFLAGVRAPIHLSTYFQGFLVNTNLELSRFGISIPNIPYIPVEDVVTLDDSGVLILDWFINFAKGFFNFINFLVDILNFLVLLINTIIQLIQFIFIFLKNLITMKNDIAGYYN